MPCYYVPIKTKEEIIKDLEDKIISRQVNVLKDAYGNLIFDGWREEDRGRLHDVCAAAFIMAHGSFEARQMILAAGFDQQELIAAHSH